MAETKENYRLVYFDVRGIGEPIRWIFAYSETPFIDERIPWDYSVWFKETKSKFSGSVGQMPVLYEKGKPELTQSHVISRYLAKKFGLVADNDWDNARIDEVISIAYDLFIYWRTTMFQRDAVQKKRLKALQDEKIRLCYRRFTEILMEKQGDFILGPKLTHADFWLANIVSILDEPFSGDHPIMADGMPAPAESDIYIGLTSAEFPLLRKHLEVVTSLPNIKEWISKRHQTII